MCKCFSYFSQNPAPSFLSSKNFSSFARMAILPLCPRAAAALPKTFARCNTAKAYPVLRRYNHLHFPISCPTKASFLWMFESPQKWAEMSDRRPRADPSRLLLPEQGGVRQQELLPGDWENIVFLIFPGHISCSSSLCQNVCFRTGALYCRTVRWRFDSSGSRGSVLSEQKSLPCPGAHIISFFIICQRHDFTTMNDFKTSDLMTTVQAFSLEPSYSRGTDCTKVTCYLARWLNNAMVMFQEVF